MGHFRQSLPGLQIIREACIKLYLCETSRNKRHVVEVGGVRNPSLHRESNFSGLSITTSIAADEEDEWTKDCFQC